MKDALGSSRKALVVVALLLVTSNQLANGQQTTSVVTVPFKSTLVQRELPYNVVLPPGYSNPANNSVRYPVLYLLHGWSGHYSDWTSRTKLSQYAAHYRLLIVTPEGNDGWYTDSAGTPADKYETYIVQELIPDVQRRFRAAEIRDGRAIAGLSMGGYGALKFAVKYPELFAFSASMSGALDAASWTAQDLRNLTAIARSLTSVFGQSDSPTRLNNDLSKLFLNVAEDKLKTLPYLYLDCGTEDPLVGSTRSLSDLLIRRKIPHEVRLLPGNHGWKYWDQQVEEVLRLTAKRLQPAK